MIRESFRPRLHPNSQRMGKRLTRGTRWVQAGYLGLKVKKEWLLRMQYVQPGFYYKKTIECRSYPPKPPLQPGDTFYLLCCGEVWAFATLQEIRSYKTLKAFQTDAAHHHVTRDTCDAAGPKSYDSFTKVFSTDGSKENSAIYGYVLSDITFFRSRPTSDTEFNVHGRSVKVPLFLGQRYGHTFFTGVFPRLH